MISVAFYKEEELDENKSEGMNLSYHASSLGTNEDEDNDQEFEGDKTTYKLFAKSVVQVSGDIRFEMVIVNLLFNSEEKLKEAIEAEFCILKNFVAIQFKSERKVRVIKIPMLKPIVLQNDDEKSSHGKVTVKTKPDLYKSEALSKIGDGKNDLKSHVQF